ncbi:hypothetical protein BDV06DRAFT_218081 [Aspergillus oleicola]
MAMNPYFSHHDPLLDELFLDPPLHIYLSAVKAPSSPKPTRHWLLILSPPNGLHATFYHVLKDPISSTSNSPSTECGSGAICEYRYHRGPILHNVPMRSTIPISNGRATLNKIGVVTRSVHDDILSIAEETLGSAANETQPWTVTFLQKLEEDGLLVEGTSRVYHRFVEPVGEGELVELLGGMEIERGEDLIEDLMGGMNLRGEDVEGADMEHEERTEGQDEGFVEID